MRVLAAILITATVFLAAWMLRAALPGMTAPAAPPALSCGRIVCMSPGITETVFALGLGGRVVGVTPFCIHPPEAQALPRIGGLLDPNYEALVALRPDLVLLTPFHREVKAELERLGLRCEVVRQDSLEEVRASFHQIGGLCDAQEAAARQEQILLTALDAVSIRVRGRPRPRTLLVSGRDLSSDRLHEVYAIGPGTFLDGLLQLAGGENVTPSGAGDYPALSAEGLLRLNPEVIIELAADFDTFSMTREQALQPWQALSAIEAVRRGRVYLLTDPHLTVPGPRVALTLEALAACLHPDPLRGTP